MAQIYIKKRHIYGREHTLKNMMMMMMVGRHTQMDYLVTVVTSVTVFGVVVAVVMI